MVRSGIRLLSYEITEHGHPHPHAATAKAGAAACFAACAAAVVYGLYLLIRH